MVIDIRKFHFLFVNMIYNPSVNKGLVSRGWELG